MKIQHCLLALRSHRRGLILALAAALAACGGGGGGGTPDPGASVTVSGIAEYESVPNNLSTGALDYNARTWRPIRGATVELIGPGGATLASGATSDRGEYSLTAANPSAAVFVRVRAQAQRSGASGGAWDVSVRDNTNGDALYTLDTTAFSPAATQTRNVRAASGWGGARYTSARAAAPFAVLDSAWSAMQTVLGVAPNQSFPPLRMFWSINNRPIDSNDLTTGNIGTSFYQFLNGQHQLYLLGAADNDSDEYDRSVVIHEFGHYLQDALSRDDSPGGPHSGDELLDRRVAFSEGWGNAWAGIVLGDPRYADSLGPQQAAGFILDVSLSTTNRGWYSEDSAQYLIWRFHQTAGIGLPPIYNVLTGPLRTSSLPASVHSFAALLKANVPAAASTIDALLQGQSITVNDGLGSGETNSGGVSGALPLYSNYSSGQMRVCVNDNIGRPNKVGNYVYVRFTTASAGSRTITVAVADGVTGTDPDIELIRADGSSTRSVSEVPGNETFIDTLPAGTHTLMINDYNLLTSTSAVGQRCFNLSVQ